MGCVTQSERAQEWCSLPIKTRYHKRGHCFLTGLPSDNGVLNSISEGVAEVEAASDIGRGNAKHEDALRGHVSHSFPLGLDQN